MESNEAIEKAEQSSQTKYSIEFSTACLWPPYMLKVTDRWSKLHRINYLVGELRSIVTMFLTDRISSIFTPV